MVYHIHVDYTMNKLAFGLFSMFCAVSIIMLNSCNKEELPSLTTLSVTETTSNSAISGGNITSDGGGEITSRGLIWSTEASPSLEQNMGLTTEGGGAGSFTSQISGLSPGTMYYVRAYAVNGAGVSYGNQIDFVTISRPVAGFFAFPLMGTAPFEVSFSDQSANEPDSWHWDFGDGNTSNMQSPTHVYTQPGKYTVQLTVGRYSEMDSYTEEDIVIVLEPLELETGTFNDSRDFQAYKWVKIGNQVWMAENLNYETEDSWCYDDSPVQCANYGRLYPWHTAMAGQPSSNANPSEVQGVCPPGWHMPSHDEWTELERYVCETLGNADCESHFPYDLLASGWRGTNEGNALRSCRQVNAPFGEDCNTSEHPRWSSGVYHGIDYFGFSALPGSPRDSVGTGGDYGSYSVWWSATEQTSSSAWRHSLGKDFSQIHYNFCTKANGFHVRCIRDED